MRWSILILSVKSRHELLARLLSALNPQLTKEVEIIIGIDDRSTPVWQRRNHLLAAAAGMYVTYIDDDDTPSDNYVASILYELEGEPDCVGFKVNRYTDGQLLGHAIHRYCYSAYADSKTDSGIIFHRPINHLCAVKTAIARQVSYRDDVMEDIDYALRLRPLLKTERFIDDCLYNYYFVSPANRDVAR